MIKIKKFLKIFCVVIGILILLILGIIYYLKINYSNNIFYFRDYGFLIEHSSRMEPKIYKNELVVFKQIEEYDLDDIIVYTDFNNNLLVRRIVQIDEYGFIARADENKFPEPDADINTIKGKVIYHSKILGKIFNW